MAWKGLWWWRRIFEMDSASFEGSRVGRLREEKGRVWRERKRVWIILNAINGFAQLAAISNQVFWKNIAERTTSIRRTFNRE